MKKFFIAIGKALLYLGAYLGAQMATSFGISLLLGFIISFKMTLANNGHLNMLEYMEVYTNAVSEAIYYILIIAGIINLLIYGIVTLIRKKKFFTEISLKKMNPVTIVPIVLGGISLNFLLSLLMAIIPFPQEWWDSYMTSSDQLLGYTGIAMWIATVISAPIVEEIVFRGFIYSRLKKGMPLVVAMLLTSIAFGAAHGTIIWFTYTFLFSMVLIFVLERTKSLWSNIILHMSFNLVGAATSTFTEVFDNLNEIAIYAGSFVVCVAAAVWFVLLTKKKEESVSI